MERWQRFYFLVPKFNPVGGIVRDLCFAAHARDLGYEVVVGCKETYDPNLPIFGIRTSANSHRKTASRSSTCETLR